MKCVHGIIVGSGEAVLRSETVLNGDDYSSYSDCHFFAEFVECPGGCTASDEAAAMEVNNER